MFNVFTVDLYNIFIFIYSQKVIKYNYNNNK